MSSQHTKLFTDLNAPFVDERSRQGQGNRQFKYVTAVQVMNRLDDVLGPENWEDKYELQNLGAICSLTIQLPDGTRITKQGFGGGANMDDGADDFKSVESDALKRAARKFGVGRYLSEDGVPTFAAVAFEGEHAKKAQSNGSSHSGYSGSNGQSGGGGSNGTGYQLDYKCPSTGKALFAWMSKLQEKFGVNVLTEVNNHPQIRNIFPNRMTEWDQNQIAFGYSVMVEAWKKAGVWPAGAGESPGEVPNGTPASAPGALAQPEAVDADAIRAVKSKIKDTFFEIIDIEQPGHGKITMPIFMDRIHRLVKPLIGVEIANFAAETDIEKLNMVLGVGRNTLKGLKAPQAAASSAEDEDIPF